MLKKDNNNEELSSEAKERVIKLQRIIDNFEDVSLKFGPASAEELKDRINKIVRNFDREFKKILDTKFELFWENQNSNHSSNSKMLNTDIPKFLKNYKK